MPDLTQTIVISGIASTGLVVVLTILRQRRFETTDLGSFVIAYFSGSNFPPAIHLCLYVFNQDPKVAESSLAGYEKYISLAGLVLLLVGATALWNLIKTAWAKPLPPALSNGKNKGE